MSEDLAALGISADLAVHYVRAGWLRRLARGVFCRPNDPPALHPSLLLLQRRLEGLHVGGRSALDWYGLRQYVAQQPVLQLYGWAAGRLPLWFTERFPAEYHRKRLFDERPEALLHVGPFEQRREAPRVSAPERALLELLSEVGVRQTLQEARELVESTYNLRADVLRELLQHCTSVKTVRLCLLLGREGSLPWMSKLDPATLPKGSDRPWVSRSAEGLLVLKP
ncbi:MAG: type IV toxin-antitoxin system AbiEi family antitoxin [Steroidobacteraceae bacterium]|nr:type IV toxin-antitoxin system AbiEi family antitoxin [Steroidobacteraceae bacterium]